MRAPCAAQLPRRALFGAAAAVRGLRWFHVDLSRQLVVLNPTDRRKHEQQLTSMLRILQPNTFHDVFDLELKHFLSFDFFKVNFSGFQQMGGAGDDGAL